MNNFVRYIYIIEEKNGDTFLYLDSQPIRFNGLKDAKPTATPGEKYIDTSGIFRETLNQNKELVSNAYTDKWGTFISVSVPIIDPAGSGTIALLGVDMDLSDYYKTAQPSQITVLAISFSLIILSIFIFLYLRNQHFYKIKINLEKQKTEKYLELSPVLILSLDITGKINMINKAGCEILEGDAQDILNKNWFENFLPEDNRSDVKNLIQKIAKSSEFYVFKPTENEIVTLKGNRKVILWNNNVIRKENGEVVEVISSGQDITKKKDRRIGVGQY